jgi:hypothetical protein
MKDDRDLEEIAFTTFICSLGIMLALAILGISYAAGGWVGPIILAGVVTGGYFAGKYMSTFH